MFIFLAEGHVRDSTCIYLGVSMINSLLINQMCSHVNSLLNETINVTFGHLCPVVQCQQSVPVFNLNCNIKYNTTTIKTCLCNWWLCCFL